MSVKVYVNIRLIADKNVIVQPTFAAGHPSGKGNRDIFIYLVSYLFISL